MRTWTVALFLLIGLGATAQAAGISPHLAESPFAHSALPVLTALGLAAASKLR